MKHYIGDLFIFNKYKLIITHRHLLENDLVFGVNLRNKTICKWVSNYFNEYIKVY